MTISIANGGWCQWDNQLGSFNGQAGSGYPLTNGQLWPSSWARAAGVTLDQDQVLALLEERDTMQLDFARWPEGGHPCVLSKDAFLSRLTQSEMISILTASKTSQSVELLVFRFSQTSAADLRSEVLQESVFALETAGLLAAGRANEILGK